MKRRKIIKLLRVIEKVSFVLLLAGWGFCAIAELTNPPTTEKIFNSIGISNYSIFCAVLVVSTVLILCVVPLIIKKLGDD
jgi:hypothetical protein